jgi:thiosulfate reductase cytochrome b subunit
MRFDEDVPGGEMTKAITATEVDQTDLPERMATEKHPRAIRWMHWFNVPILTVMIWSGLRIYWSYDVSRVPSIRFGEETLFPEGFYDVLQLDRKLARGMAFHFSFGWLFLINGLLYVLYLAASKEWKHLIPRFADIKKIPALLLHDIGLRKEAPEQGQYNVMQQLAYSGVTVLGFLAVATGFAIYKPVQLSWLTSIFGGYQSARLIHFIVTMSFLAFFVVHIIQVVRAGFGNFWSMVTGYELEPADEPVLE